MRKFNLLIKSISPEDKIGHLFIIDIKLNEKNADEKNLLFNEIYTPIFQKDICLPKMFAKLSLMSFIYELVEAFFFPNEKTKKIMKNVY